MSSNSHSLAFDEIDEGIEFPHLRLVETGQVPNQHSPVEESTLLIQGTVTVSF